MFPLKRILCPVDFSAPSLEGLKVVERVVRLSTCPVLTVPGPGGES